MANISRFIGQAVNQVRKDRGRESRYVAQYIRDRDKCCILPVGEPTPAGFERICTCSPSGDDNVLVQFNA